MPRVSRTLIIQEDEETIELGSGMLRRLFALGTEQALKFLARHGCIHNEMSCPKCYKLMGLVKVKDRSDGFAWRCSKCGNVERSVRDGSLFSKSKLPITTLILIMYVWTTDWGNNTFIEQELEVRSASAVKHQLSGRFR